MRFSLKKFDQNKEFFPPIPIQTRSIEVSSTERNDRLTQTPSTKYAVVRLTRLTKLQIAKALKGDFSDWI